jgi:uncharacterized membrane protein YgcG
VNARCPKTGGVCTHGCSRTPAGIVTHCRARTSDDPGRTWPETSAPSMPVVDLTDWSIDDVGSSIDRDLFSGGGGGFDGGGASGSF